MVEYSSQVLWHFQHAERKGILDLALQGVYHATIGDRTSPAIMHLYIKLNNVKVIEDTRFLVYGDVAAIATISWLAEYLINKHSDDIKDIQSDFILEQLNLDSQHYYCALMAEDLLQNILGSDPCG